MPNPMVIGGGIAAAGTIGGALIQSDASSDASREMAKATKYAADLQFQQYQLARSDLAPWREAGGESLNTLRGMMGLSYQPNYLTPSTDAEQAPVQPIQPSPGQGVPPGVTIGYHPETGELGYWGEGPRKFGGYVKKTDKWGKVDRVPKWTTRPEWKPYTPSTTTPDVAATTAAVPAETAQTPSGGIATGYMRLPGQETVRYDPITGESTTTTQAETPPGETIPGTGPIYSGPPVFEAPTAEDFEASPGYQFTVSEGQKGIQNALAAMGRSRSGSHLRAATEYAQDMASTEYDNFLRRWYNEWNTRESAYYNALKPYQSLAGLGQTSATQGGYLGAQAAGAAGQAALIGGQAAAQNQINQGNILSGAITGGANQLLYLNALRNLPQYGGAGGGYYSSYPQNYVPPGSGYTPYR